MQGRSCLNLLALTSAVVTTFFVATSSASRSESDAQSFDPWSRSVRTRPSTGSGELHSSMLRRSPGPTKTRGCGVVHVEGYSSDTEHLNLESDGITRHYTIEVPPGYNHRKDEHWPLILDFHGAGHTSVDQHNNSRYFAVAGGDKYIVVYPQGRGNVWEGAGYSIEGVDDIGFVVDLLDHLKSIYCIDSDRIYASGKSNGGGFVDLLACSDAGDYFAAFVLASAALYSDNSITATASGGCPKSRAILESHGGKDKTIPYEGQSAMEGNGGATPDIQSWLGWWAHRNGCQEDQRPIIDDSHEGYTIASYSCGDYHKVVQSYYIPKLGHCWPSTDGKNSDAGARVEGCSFRGLDFTSIALDWFGRWDRNSAPQN